VGGRRFAPSRPGISKCHSLHAPYVAAVGGRRGTCTAGFTHHSVSTGLKLHRRTRRTARRLAAKQDEASLTRARCVRLAASKPAVVALTAPDQLPCLKNATPIGNATTMALCSLQLASTTRRLLHSLHLGFGTVVPALILF
jgi:hypothetical protein